MFFFFLLFPEAVCTMVVTIAQVGSHTDDLSINFSLCMLLVLTF